MAEINATQLRDALAWVTNDKETGSEPSTNPFVWFWEAVEGDFNENRSTAQIMVDAGISMIPLVDQVCDVRDLIANCRKLSRDSRDTWAWVALALTLIGLFPSLGSLVKGVLKIFFGFIRHSGGTAVAKAVDDAMTWVTSFLRRRDVQRYLRTYRVDETYKWLADRIKLVKSKVQAPVLIAAFDRGIRVLSGLVDRVESIPVVGRSAKGALEEVRRVRLQADRHLATAVKPVQDLIDAIVLRLEKETLAARHGIVDVGNIHYKGALPEAAAIRLMRKRQPRWLSKNGEKEVPQAEPVRHRAYVDALSAKVDAHGNPRPSNEIFPPLSDRSIRSFETLEAHVVRGPARLYRILAPNSRAMSDCWVTQEVFERLQSSANPKEAWRRYLAVWPDWNVDGQFVVYDVKAGETLNTWRGPASSQKNAQLDGFHLEGGWEQIVFNIERGDVRHDSVIYYPIKANGSLGKPISQNQVNVMTASMNQDQKTLFFEKYLGVREKINHPNISGPFETGWGYDDFDGAGLYSKIGLPALPGQTTTINP
jgi:hypothetical protein